MKKLYTAIAIVTLLFIGDMTRSHFDKRVQSELYFKLFDSNGTERVIRRELMHKRIRENVEKKRELSANAK